MVVESTSEGDEGTGAAQGSSLSQEATGEEREPNTERGEAGAEADREAEGEGQGDAREAVDGQAEGLEPEEEDEGRQPKMLANPITVSKKQREEHELTHLPYRSWCAHCVRGRGRSTAHKAKKGDTEEEETARVVMDYFYMHSSVGETDEDKCPSIVMVNEKTSERYARVVAKKGVGPEVDWVVRDIAEELKMWGHPGGPQDKLIIKTDGEPAIMALRDQLARMHGGQTMVETSAKEEHQSNGIAEESVRTVRGMTLTLKNQLEQNTGSKIHSDQCITQWMLRWSAMLLSRYMVGRDGKTGYERRRGRSCAIPTVCFGEVIWYKEGKAKEARAKFESEWKQGLWLGHTRASNEAWVGTSSGAVKAHDIKRMPKEDRWKGDMVSAMKGTPQKPNPTQVGEEAVIEMDMPELKMDDQAVDKKEEEIKPRRTNITDKELSQFGFTPGCPGCVQRKQGRAAKKGHSEECRKRIERDGEDRGRQAEDGAHEGEDDRGLDQGTGEERQGQEGGQGSEHGDTTTRTTRTRTPSTRSRTATGTSTTSRRSRTATGTSTTSRRRTTKRASTTTGAKRRRRSRRSGGHGPGGNQRKH